jgi:hexosaminidase
MPLEKSTLTETDNGELKVKRNKPINLIRPLMVAAMLIFLPGTSSGKTQNLPLVPKPVSVEVMSGEAHLSGMPLLVLPSQADASWEATARVFIGKVENRRNIMIELVSEQELQARISQSSIEDVCPGAILIGDAADACALAPPPYEDPSVHKEGYALTTTGVILINASTPQGMHNGLMTLLQVIEAGHGGDFPIVSIVDYPRFQWRGMLMDSSRSFLPPDVIKSFINRLSELKINVFHWHIVDDQGWRIESKVYPRLHEEAGILHNMSDKKLRALARVEMDGNGMRLSGKRFSSKEEAASSRGYYTQEELKEIVAYAAERQIMIVPEIDVPGHSTEMIAAYPELQCSGEPIEVAKVGQLARNAICPGKEEVYVFLDQLFAELATIFPAPYMHIGSDEVWTTEWMEAPENQWLIEEYGYVDNDGLQSYFVERVHKILKKHGKTMIAWDEVTDYAPDESIVQAWRKHEYAREAAERGLDSIVSPVTHCYIDYPQLNFTLKNLYHFEPVPKGLDPDYEHHILGGEVNLWSERVTLDNVDKKAFPRVIAHSEVMWTPPEQKDWKDFVDRMGPVRKGMKERGTKFGKTWRDLMLIPW